LLSVVEADEVRQRDVAGAHLLRDGLDRLEALLMFRHLVLMDRAVQSDLRPSHQGHTRDVRGSSSSVDESICEEAVAQHAGPGLGARAFLGVETVNNVVLQRTTWVGRIRCMNHVIDEELDRWLVHDVGLCRPVQVCLALARCVRPVCELPEGIRFLELVPQSVRCTRIGGTQLQDAEARETGLLQVIANQRREVQTEYKLYIVLYYHGILIRWLGIKIDGMINRFQMGHDNCYVFISVTFAGLF